MTAPDLRCGCKAVVFANVVVTRDGWQHSPEQCGGPPKDEPSTESALRSVASELLRLKDTEPVNGEIYDLRTWSEIHKHAKEQAAAWSRLRAILTETSEEERR